MRVAAEPSERVEYAASHSYTASAAEVVSGVNQDMAEEMRALRQELAESKRIQAEQAKAMQDLLKLHSRWNGEGMPADREDYLKTMAEA